MIEITIIKLRDFLQHSYYFRTDIGSCKFSPIKYNEVTPSAVKITGGGGGAAAGNNTKEAALIRPETQGIDLKLHKITFSSLLIFHFDIGEHCIDANHM